MENSLYLPYLLLSSYFPMPLDNPDSILDDFNGEFSLQYQAELNYLRGNFSAVTDYFLTVAIDSPLYLCACTITIPAAISQGNYALCEQILLSIEGLQSTAGSPAFHAQLQAVSAGAMVNMSIPGLAPQWLRHGNFRTMPPESRSYLLYIYARYLESRKFYHEMLAVSKAGLTLISSAGITSMDIYLRLTCAAACLYTNELEQAKDYLCESMELALPHGLLVPFSDLLMLFGGLMEQYIIQRFPETCSSILKIHSLTFLNWLECHNRYAKEHITLILTRREYQIAVLAKFGMSNQQIADHLHISINTVKTTMKVIFDKLFIRKRSDLNDLIL